MRSTRRPSGDARYAAKRVAMAGCGARVGIVKAYTIGKQADLEKIVSDSEQMNKHAVRLETNLFPQMEEQKGKKKSKENKTVDPAAVPLPQDLKALIVEQDNTLASFISNPMFANPQVANVTDSAKAHADLKKLILLTAALRSEAGNGLR